MGKKTWRHGLIWDRVDRIQTSIDMRKTTTPVAIARELPVAKEKDHKHRDLLNSYRL